MQKNPELINQCVNYCQTLNEISVDTETTGLNFMTDDFLSIQLGDDERQYVLPPEAIDDPRIRKLLTSKNLILQNAKFDLGFFMTRGLITDGRIYDTMLSERVLTVGTRHKVGLQHIMKKYFNFEMDKTIRMKLEALGIDHPEFQRYAAKDIEVLPKIKKLQMKEIKRLDLGECINLENAFVPVLTYIEHCGFYLNKQKWKLKMSKDLEAVKKQLDILDNVAFKHGLTPYVKTKTLFGEQTDRLINWNSSHVVIEILESLGLDLSYYDKKSKKTKKSVEAKLLKKFKDDHELVSPYLKYKKLEKITTSYGMGYLTELAKYPDGRLRTRFTQIKDTGRLASGSGKVNFQNIPRVPEKKKRTREIYERECFEPEKGNILVTADYSSQESRLLAFFSQDKALVDFYNSGEADLHSYATKLVFKADYPEMENMNLANIKNNFPELRNVMKGFNFASMAPCCRKAA